MKSKIGQQEVFEDFPESEQQSSKVTFIFKSGAILEMEFGFDALEFMSLWSLKDKKMTGVDIANNRFYSINKKDVSSFFINGFPKDFLENCI